MAANWSVRVSCWLLDSSCKLLPVAMPVRLLDLPMTRQTLYTYDGLEGNKLTCHAAWQARYAAQDFKGEPQVASNCPTTASSSPTLSWPLIGRPPNSQYADVCPRQDGARAFPLTRPPLERLGGWVPSVPALCRGRDRQLVVDGLADYRLHGEDWHRGPAGLACVSQRTYDGHVTNA